MASSVDGSPVSAGAPASPGVAAEDVEVDVHAGAGAAAAAPKSRMVLNKMVIQQFKSYGGRTTIGPFHTSMSAVVGPNGSGKSNVIDALMFVFGYRANKMRQDKVSSLVHKSSTYPDLDFARVEVHFVDIIDHEDGTKEHVAGTELVVARVANVDNSSKYYLNGKASTYTGVTSLLKGRGIDLDNNRFLILQGEVEQISMMPPKARNAHETGMLEYLEDICGSCKFVEPIAEAAKDVEEFNEARLLEFKRCKAVEAEKETLEASKTEALSFLQMERQVMVVKHTMEGKHLHDSEARLHAVVEEREKHVVELTAATAAITAKEQAEVPDVEKRLKTQKKVAEKARNKELEQRAQFAEFEKKDIQARESMKHMASVAKKQSAAKTREAKKAVAEEARMAELEASIPALEAARDDCAAAKEEADSKVEVVLQSLVGKAEAHRGEMEAKTKELEPFREAIASEETAAHTVRTQATLLTERMQGAAKEQETLLKLKAELSSNLADAEATIASCDKVVSVGQTRMKPLAKELEAAARREGAAKDALRAARGQCEERKQAFAASASRSQLSVKLMEATGRGNPLHGVKLYGRLGDLGAIDAEYDVAISTACSMLDAFVVQAQADAKAVFDALRAMGGRARLIILDELSEELLTLMSRSVATPKGCARLFDLVRTDAKFQPAFYKVLGNTLVADTTENAQVAAYGRDRSGKARCNVVTKAGLFFSASGTLSGGGKPRKGGMSSSPVDPVSEEEVKAAEVSLDTAQHDFEEAKAAHAELQAEMKRLKAEVPKAELALSKAKLEADSLATRLTELTSRLDELEGHTDPTAEQEAELRALEKQLRVHDAAINKAKKASAALEADVQQLQQQILDAGGKPLEMAKADAAACAKALADAEKAVTKARVDAKAAAKAAKKSTTAAAKAEAEVEKAKAKIEELKEEAARLCEQAVEVDEAIAVSAEAAAKEHKAQLELQKEFNALMQGVSALRDKEADVKHTIEKLDDSIAVLRGNVKHHTKQLETVAAEFQATLFADELETATPSAADAGGEEAEVVEEEELEDAGVEESKAERSTKDVAADAAPPSDDDDDDDDDVGRSKPLHSVLADDAPLIRALPVLTPEQFDDMDMRDLERQLKMIQRQRDHHKGSVQLTAIEEYRKKAAEHQERLDVLAEVSTKRDAARKVYEGLRKKRLDVFMSAFSIITMKLKEMYQMITLGGDAELELVDSLDPFAEGIVFSVRPPNKSWKNISNLSGGEKTLSSLALVFALHHYKPTPLYVMDEIDAALDFKNVSIIANYIKERTKDAQFVIISLRNNMFELADRLIGIYKTNDVTKSVAINPKEFTVPAAGAGAGAGMPSSRARKTASGSTRTRRALADRSNVAEDEEDA